MKNLQVIRQNSKTFLKKFFPGADDPIMTNTDETTQESLRLMDQIRNSKLFTIPTVGDILRLTQRNTNLCVAIAAMRLLCFALISFLGENIKSDQLKELKTTLREKIISFPKIQKESEEVDSQNQPSGKFVYFFSFKTSVLY